MALRYINAYRPTALAAGLTTVVLGLGAGGSPSASYATSGESECAALEPYGDLNGANISVYFPNVDPEDQYYIASFERFERCTGATIEYEGTLELPAQLPVRVEAGTPPDIASIPQPGLLATLVATGSVVPAPEAVSENVDLFWGEDWRAYGTVDGTLYGAPLGANVKSLVWYSPSTFADHGYSVPQTYDELMQLTEQIANDDPDARPWCAGFGSGEATGWVGTDWLEDLLLRTAGPDVYDMWVSHEIPFNDPQVAAALARVGEILKNPDYVNGGFGDVESIATTTFQDAGQGVLDGSCSLHRQASFYAAQWPEGTTVAEDGDVFAFYLPAIDAAMGNPVLGAGDFIVAFSDRPEVQAFQTYLSTDTYANDKAVATPQGGWVSANSGLDVANLTGPIDRLSAEILQDPQAVFRFDASDQMPSAVGSGTFWREMVSWITGQSDEDTLDAIEQSWPD